MPRTVTTLLSSKFLASLPSTTSLLLSHDLHDLLLHVELLLLSLEPLLLSPGTQSFSCPTASNNFSHLSMAALNLASNHTSMVLSWLLFHNSGLLSPLLSTHSSTSAPNHSWTTTPLHYDTLLEREVGQRHCSPSSGDLYLIFNRAKQISTCMAIYILLLYKNAYTPRKYSCTTTIADSEISVTQLSLDLDFQLLP